MIGSPDTSWELTWQIGLFAGRMNAIGRQFLGGYLIDLARGWLLLDVAVAIMTIARAFARLGHEQLFNWRNRGRPQIEVLLRDGNFDAMLAKFAVNHKVQITQDLGAASGIAN